MYDRLWRVITMEVVNLLYALNVAVLYLQGDYGHGMFAQCRVFDYLYFSINFLQIPFWQ